MSTKEVAAVAPRLWIGESCDEVSLSPVEGWEELIRFEEHESLLKAEQEKCKKLEWQLKQFKTWGTNNCNSCEGGRITLFYANGECTSCNPKSYDSYEKQVSELKEATEEGGK